MGALVKWLPMHVEYHEASAGYAHRRIVVFFREHLDG
jgi:hypothetical protein